MKEVMAIIRMNKIIETKKALADAGYVSMTARKVYGRGKKKVDYELIEDMIESTSVASKEVLESISENHRLIAKRLLTMIIPDEGVDEVVKIIIDINQTGSMGDGKIFIIPVEEAVRIRTDETGALAI